MSQKVLKRRTDTKSGLEASLEAVQNKQDAVPIPHPPQDPEVIKAECDSFTLESFTTADAWDLGHLLYARLLPLADVRPCLISIAHANSSQILFQTVTGPGATPDNEKWVERKRNSVLRWGKSTWFLHCSMKGDEAGFAAKFALDPVQAGKYAIHGGGVPIRVKGVDGVAAVVVVSGLPQQEDHGVIVDVFRNNWA